MRRISKVTAGDAGINGP